jgi:hypothetical protein
MLREKLQGFKTMGVAQLELATFIVQVSDVVRWLKQKATATIALLEIAFGLVNVALSQFQNSEVVERLSVICVVADTYLESLVCQS